MTIHRAGLISIIVCGLFVVLPGCNGDKTAEPTKPGVSKPGSDKTGAPDTNAKTNEAPPAKTVEEVPKTKLAKEVPDAGETPTTGEPTGDAGTKAATGVLPEPDFKLKGPELKTPASSPGSKLRDSDKPKLMDLNLKKEE